MAAELEFIQISSKPFASLCLKPSDLHTHIFSYYFKANAIPSLQRLQQSLNISLFIDLSFFISRVAGFCSSSALVLREHQPANVFVMAGSCACYQSIRHQILYATHRVQCKIFVKHPPNKKGSSHFGTCMLPDLS